MGESEPQPHPAVVDDEPGATYATSSPLSPAQGCDVVGIFALLYGLVSLEVDHHPDGVTSDVGRVLRDELDRAVEALAAGH